MNITTIIILLLLACSFWAHYINDLNQRNIFDRLGKTESKLSVLWAERKDDSFDLE